MGNVIAYMNDYELCTDCQHGFHKNSSGVTQLQHVVEDLSDIFNNYDPYDIIYFDFKKAFGQVYGSILGCIDMLCP